ncbi:hypothetical protein HYALB_00013325 [Hymenoscyphus albidus]|uniref:Uncharacterized protein n=1 Tax=Hymenoscyphus albidus TaxID=595503 RepID=A0A9N9LTK5_9HELO|nr:hypothetical protein HYALB_00013325 [Hymenoscyphus albidus]
MAILQTPPRSTKGLLHGRAGMSGGGTGAEVGAMKSGLRGGVGRRVRRWRRGGGLAADAPAFFAVPIPDPDPDPDPDPALQELTTQSIPHPSLGGGVGGPKLVGLSGLVGDVGLSGGVEGSWIYCGGSLF